LEKVLAALGEHYHLLIRAAEAGVGVVLAVVELMQQQGMGELVVHMEEVLAEE
jgi:hypothetical protein